MSVYELQREVAQLRAQNQELMHINNEWDKEYREQREAFHRYQADAQLAQTENHAAIARLKEKLSSVEEERDRLEDELGRHQRELHGLRERLAMAESVTAGGLGGSEVEEELCILRQQLKVYAEDFLAEKSEKERLRDEKQSVAIRYEAEKMSLQLQLDRCQADLAHFTVEANRLAQQLKLKNQFEEERYREHLETKGFVPRCPGSLPPLDPYVEIDQRFLQTPHRAGSGSRLYNGTQRAVQHPATVQNHHVHRAEQHALGSDFARLSLSHGRVSPARRRTPNLSHAANNTSSYRLVARGLEKEDAYPGKVSSDGLSSSDSSSSVDSDGAEELADLSPTASKGRYACPRCAGLFQEKAAFQQHRDRCLV